MTGLEWVQDGNLIVTSHPEFDNDETPGDGQVTWRHALEYIDLLNDEGYLGHDDWRLPGLEELSTLVDAGRYNPAIDPIFDTVADWVGYWSSTTDVSDPDSAWSVSFDNGNVDDGGKERPQLRTRRAGRTLWVIWYVC